MNLLLDSCTFYWLCEEHNRLSERAKKIFLDEENTAFLSVVSMWELTVKQQLGRIRFDEDPYTFFYHQCQYADITMLPLNPDAIEHLPSLPTVHNDPFDRMLICQAKTHDLTILTPDQKIHQYDVTCAW